MMISPSLCKTRWSLQVMVMALLFFSAIRGISSLNPLQKQGVVGVWDKSKLDASLFRDNFARTSFSVWPEDSKDAKYLCVDHTGVYVLENFTYSLYETTLDSRPYYDVGIADEYLPYTFEAYFKHMTFWGLNTTRITYPLRCELHDIQAVYFQRQHHKLPIISAKWIVCFTLVFEFVTIVPTSIFWLCLGPGFWFPHSEEGGRATFKNGAVVVKRIFLLLFKDNFTDLLHIGLLFSAGNFMTENVGHSDIRGLRPTAFYNVGVLYKHITILAIIAASLLQFCLALFFYKREIEIAEKKRQPSLNPVDVIELLRGNNNYLESLQSVIDATPDVPLTSRFSDDWRWQRIFGQGAVILLTGTLLDCVEDNTGTSLDVLAGLVLATVVVACSWSVGVTAVTIFTCIFYIFGQLLTCLCHTSRPGRTSRVVVPHRSDLTDQPKDL